jgi:hypothetical protein
MSTYGDIRFRVSQQLPGVALALIDGWLLDRYTQILDRLKWKRQEAVATIETVASYSAGTLAVTQGSAAFTSNMTGMSIAIDCRKEAYQFTFLTSTTGTLDRGFEGPTDALASFRIYQAIYALPADCKIIGQIVSNLWGPLERFTGERLRDSIGETRIFGPPRIFAPSMDSSDPPCMQVELTPIPETAHSLVLTYTAEAQALSGTAVTMQPWMRPAALVAGALADGYAFLKYWNSSDRQMAGYESYVEDMVRTDSLNRGSRPIKMASWLTRHNTARAIRSTQRYGPRLP